MFLLAAEEGAGVHTDGVLTLSGLEILMLRENGACSSVTERAQEVRRRLDAVLTLGNGIFFPGFGVKGPSVLFRSAATHQRVTVLEVTLPTLSLGLSLMIGMSSGLSAAGDHPSGADEATILEIVQAMEDGWEQVVLQERVPTSRQRMPGVRSSGARGRRRQFMDLSKRVLPRRGRLRRAARPRKREGGLQLQVLQGEVSPSR